MNKSLFEVGGGYEIVAPPLLEVAGQPSHQLGRFFTVLSVHDEGIVVYDGSYASGFSSLFLSNEIVAGLESKRITHSEDEPTAALVGAIESALNAAIEHRVMVAEHGGEEKGIHASHRFFAQYLSGQIKGLAAKGLASPGLAVTMIDLATGVGVDQEA
ncbi:hypothetical protein [Pseudomonas abietaniphila]|uniref:Uncharacterized protein n=1 Tax=Pseudomonas abietaniphila TaxID=89065 RepID=A0A1G8QX14_9PSED|nr:hypothetical protein [Pseudomonas abietaniphila]SDJ09282.1 hypothetical protein SAMN05216605_12193 [Pseudomonas abietaniphila]